MNTDKVQYATITGWVAPPIDVLPALEGDVECQVAVIGRPQRDVDCPAAGRARPGRGPDGGRVLRPRVELAQRRPARRSAGWGPPAAQPAVPQEDAWHDAARQARSHHVEDFISKHNIDGDYEATGNAFVATSRGQMGRVRRVAKIIARAGGRGQLGTSEQLGIPRGFVGGMREEVGGGVRHGWV